MRLPVFSGQPEHEKQGKFRNGFGIASPRRRYIRDIDARRGGCWDIDRVQTRAVLLDEFQPRRTQRLAADR